MRIVAVRGRPAPVGQALLATWADSSHASDAQAGRLGLARLRTETVQGSEARNTKLGRQSGKAEPVQAQDANGHVQVFPTGTILLQESFDDTNVGSRGWYDNSQGVTLSTTEQRTGAACLQIAFAAGGTQPAWSRLRHLFTVSPTLYLSAWLKYSSNWVGSGRAYHPHEFELLSSLDADYDALADNYLAIYLEHNYQSGGIPRFAVQDNRSINPSASVFRTGSGTIGGADVVATTETRSVGGANGGVETSLFWESFAFDTAIGYYNDKRLDASVIAPATWRNTWNHVEAYWAINTIAAGIGQHDGTFQYWFNGTLLVDRHDVLYRTGARPNIGFHQLVLCPYIGDGSPVAQTIWMDDLVLATAPV